MQSVKARWLTKVPADTALHSFICPGCERTIQLKVPMKAEEGMEVICLHCQRKLTVMKVGFLLFDTEQHVPKTYAPPQIIRVAPFTLPDKWKDNGDSVEG